MNKTEAIEELELIKARIEWEYPLEGQIALDMAIKALEPNLLCALADRECPFQGKEYAWCLTCPHISEEDRALMKEVALEPKRGKWIPIIEGNEFGEPYPSGVYCSECGETCGCEANYCPNCGAKMETEQ